MARTYPQDIVTPISAYCRAWLEARGLNVTTRAEFEAAALRRLADILRGTDSGTGVFLRVGPDPEHRPPAVGAYSWCGARTIQVVRHSQIVASFTPESVLDAPASLVRYAVQRGHGAVR